MGSRPNWKSSDNTPSVFLPRWEAPQYLIAHSIMLKILKKGYGLKEKIRYGCMHRADTYGLYVCAYTLLRQPGLGLGRNQTLALAKKLSRK